MREPEALTGDWVIATPSTTCAVTFTMRRIDSANGWAIADPMECLSTLVAGAVAWRPTPEGVALAGADRLTLASFIAGDGVQTGTALLNGTKATLRRK